jgi:hypothetical protein
LLHPTFAAIAVSRDHKPDQTDERQRIEEAGGFVMWAGIFMRPLELATSLWLITSINSDSLLFFFLQGHGVLVVFLLFLEHLVINF